MNLSSIAGIAAGLLGGPYGMILGRILDAGTNWKAVAVDEGLDVVNGRLRALWRGKIMPAELDAIARDMRGEGWGWSSASDPGFRKTQKVEILASEEALGPGFVISRDAVYAILRESGVPGGATRDGWRDSVDNAVWAEVVATGKISEASSLEEIVAATFDALVERSL